MWRARIVRTWHESDIIAGLVRLGPLGAGPAVGAADEGGSAFMEFHTACQRAQAFLSGRCGFQSILLIIRRPTALVEIEGLARSLFHQRVGCSDKAPAFESPPRSHAS